MLDNEGKSLNDFTKAKLDWPWNNLNENNFIARYESSGSGGYSEHIFKYAAKTLFNQDLIELKYNNLR